MGEVGPRSTGGPTRSRMRDLNFTGQITLRNQFFVCGWRVEFKAKHLCASWYYVELSAAIPPPHFFELFKDPDFGLFKDPIYLRTEIFGSLNTFPTVI